MYSKSYNSNRIELLRRKNQIARERILATPVKNNISKVENKEIIHPKNIHLNPINRVTCYDFISPLKYFHNRVEKDTDKDYYSELIDIAKKIKKETLIISNNNKNLFNIFLHYLFFQSGVTAMILWPKSNTCFKPVTSNESTISINKETFFYKELEHYGTIHGIVCVDLNNKQMMNFIYQVYFNNRFIKTTSKLKNKLTKIKDNSNTNCFYVIFYETDKKINGKNASFKQHLRGLIQRRLGSSNSSNTLLHATDNFTEMIEMAKLLLPTSLEFLKYQNIEQVINSNHIISQLLKFKKQIYKLDIFRQELILFNKDYIDFSMGDRIDQTELRVNQYNSYLEVDDGGIIEKNTRIKYLNPDYYYYFLGLKFARLL